MTRETPLAREPFRPPPISTERLLLRGYEPTDRDAIYAYAGDPETTRYMAWNRHRDISHADFFLDHIIAPQYRGKSLSYALCLADTPEQVIGGTSVLWAPREQLVMELGYVLHKDHWGRGLMPEACRALLDLAWKETNVMRIFAPIYSENAKSRRLAEKLGMQLDGILRSHTERHGQRVDVCIYSVLRGE